MRFFIYLLLLCLILPSSAWAYIDPGTGSLILQGLAAALVSLFVFWRSLRVKIISLFTKKQAKTNQNDSKLDNNKDDFANK